MNPLLTIIVPSYNRCALLTKQLATLEIQKHPEVEVLVVLDPSRDGSEDIVRYSGFPYIINKTRLGFALSFSLGVMRAHGHYCWLLGDDDLLYPDAITRLVDELKVYRPGLLISLDGGKVLGEFPHGYYPNMATWMNCCMKDRPAILCEDMTLSARVFRRDLFDAAIADKFVHTHFGHIYAVSWGLIKSQLAVLVLQEHLYHMLPQAERPLWSEFPADLEKFVKDYLDWLQVSAGTSIDADKVLAESRQQFRQSLRHPWQFFLNHRRAAFNLGAWRYFIWRIVHWIVTCPTAERKQ